MPLPYWTATTLTACGDTSSDSSSQSGTESSSSTSAAESTSDADDPAAAAVAARTEPQTIVVNWPTYSGTLDGIDRIVEKMNELTIPALNLQVEMQITDFANRTQSVTLAISGGEQIDIISSIGVGYTNGIAKDYWEDMVQRSTVITCWKPTAPALLIRWDEMYWTPAAVLTESFTVFPSRKKTPRDVLHWQSAPSTSKQQPNI